MTSFVTHGRWPLSTCAKKKKNEMRSITITRKEKHNCIIAKSSQQYNINFLDFFP